LKESISINRRETFAARQRRKLGVDSGERALITDADEGTTNGQAFELLLPELQTGLLIHRLSLEQRGARPLAEQ
jgi:hypothetical protein